MDNPRKTKAQLLEELTALRNHVQKLQSAEKELREKSEVFQNIFELAPHLASITRIQDGRYLQVNEAFCRLTGFRIEEIIGRTPFDLNLYADPIDRQRLVDGLSKNGRVEGMEIKFQKKDGTFFYNLVSARPYRFKDEDCLLLMGTEITLMRELEISLRESEEKYRVVVDNAGEGIVVFQDGEIKFFNPRILQILGYNPEEVIGRLFIDFIHPDDREMMLNRYQSRLAGDLEPDRYEFRVLIKGGKVRSLEIRAVRITWGGRPGTLAVLDDVTDRKEMEEKYRTIIETMEEGYYEVDLTGTYTFVNPAVCRYHGAAREELIGLNNREFMHPETAKRVFELFNLVYQTGISSQTFEQDIEIIRKDGTICILQLSVSLIRDASGEAVGFRGITYDATKRKRMEAEKEKLTEQLNRAGKLEAVGTLAGGIAHDFNNLFMGIQGYASLMMMDLDPAHPHFEKLKAIEGQVRIGAELTKQLSGYARGGRYRIVSTDLNELLGKTAALFGRMKKNIRIHHHYTQPVQLVEADHGQIEQVLLSLFMNASEAMPGGGTLLLETDNVLLDESFVRPYDLKFGPYVKISVTDTGVGMDEKTRERIFEPFFTTKEMGRGVGLGLAPVYGIIKGHGGLIEVASEKGEGTTFTIYLPASPEEI